jgi:hypothetical protein
MCRLWLKGLTHAKNTSTWVAFCMTSLQLITSLATPRRSIIDNKNAIFRGGHARSDHHQWRRMSILELIVPIRLHGSSLSRASWLWGFPDKSGVRHGTDPKSAFASPHEILVGDLRGNRVARIFDCSRSKSDFNRRRFYKLHLLGVCQNVEFQV